MENYIIIALFVVVSIVLVRHYFKLYPGKDFNRVRFMTRIAIFSAIAAILYIVPVLTIKLPFFPSFLTLHFDEIPAFIAGFAYGPVSGLLVIVVKTLLKLPFTETLGVGELTDLILSGIYVFIVTFIYSKKRNLKGVAIGFGIGTVAQVTAGMFLNVYAMVPFYMAMFGIPEAGLLRIMQLAIPAITDIRWSYAFFAVLPFNLLKDAVVIVITFLVYRSLHIHLRFERK